MEDTNDEIFRKKDFFCIKRDERIAVYMDGENCWVLICFRETLDEAKKEIKNLIKRFQ